MLGNSFTQTQNVYHPSNSSNANSENALAGDGRSNTNQISQQFKRDLDKLKRRRDNSVNVEKDFASFEHQSSSSGDQVKRGPVSVGFKHQRSKNGDSEMNHSHRSILASYDNSVSAHWDATSQEKPTSKQFTSLNDICKMSAGGANLFSTRNSK